MHGDVKRTFSILFLLGIATAAAFAVPPAPSPATPPAAMISPDNPKAFDAAAATKAWLDTVPADQRAKSDAYFEGGYWLLLWDFLIAAAIMIFLLQSRISARLRDFAERTTKSKSLQVILYVIPFVLIVAALSFPMTVYEQFYREHKYDLATQTFGPWFGEQLKSLVIALIAASIVSPIIYIGLRRAPRTWWIFGTAVAIAFSIFASFIAPVFVFPLFNKYTPLTDPAIRDPILALARANQIPVDQVFVVDASRQTTRVSANVAGLFGTTRIALNDNLLNQCSLPEIREVMGHEMGHFVLNHGMKLNLYQGVFFFVAFAVMTALFHRAHRKYGERWRVRGIDDPAGLPLLLLLFSIISFITTPLTNTMVRITEREADQFGLNTSREPDGFAAVALKLGKYRKLNPGPIEEIIFFDHPSGRARIRMAMDWKGTQLPCGEDVDLARRQR
jgi:STE24 endopeptidase